VTAVGLRPPPFRPPSEPERDRSRTTEVGPAEEVDLARHPWASVAVAGALLVLVALAVVGVRAVLAANAPPPDTPRVVLPSLAALPVAEAQRQLDELGVEAAIEFTPNSLVPVGVVFGQVPRAGAKVESGSEVVVVVSDGPAGQVVPEVVGVQAPVAVGLLGRLGFRVEQQDVPDDVVRPGEVVASVPAAGSPVPDDGAIVLRVSSGPAPRVVPDVVGAPVGPGMSAIGRAGLGLGEVSERARSDVEPGTILGVDPDPGSNVPPGTPVDVVVSGPPDSATVPSLVGLTRRAAEEVAGDVVTLRIRTQALPAGDVLVGRVVDQSLPVGTPVAPGTPLELVVGVAEP
jgi:beta-lactam-binding protein with PASTA domain